MNTINTYRQWMSIFLFLILGVFSFAESGFAQTTGKIAGRVTDQSDATGLAGANIYLENSSLGASADAEGDFYIINIPPGTYTVVVQMVGYKTQRIVDFRVSVNRTAFVEAALEPSIMEGEVIEVRAEKVSVKKDQTSSMSTVSSEQMDLMPVENLDAVVAMQAGVVNGHFRGGRSSEASYMIDGIQVDDAFGGEGRVVDLETESVEDVEIITGTFNAEYGRAMAGIVNSVVKDGGEKHKISVSSDFAGYVTGNDDIFIGINDGGFVRNQDYKLQFSGPVLPGKVFYFLNMRFQNNNNYLNGIRRFEMDDYSDFNSTDPSLWYSEHNGDNSYVPMNGSENLSVLGKLSYKVTDHIRTSLLFTRNQDVWNQYIHAYKYNPDGRAAAHRTSDLLAFSLNHTLSTKAFYEFKVSRLVSENAYYLYKNPLDSRYLYDAYHGNINETGFYTGGQMKDHSKSTQTDINIKFDLTWQASRAHALKTGFLYTKRNLKSRWAPVRTDSTITVEDLNMFYYDENGKRVYPNYVPMVFPDNSVYSDIYEADPIEISAYLQDKMEYDDLVMNIGIRIDYFDPNSTYPSQRRNPANQLNFYLKDANGALILDDSGNKQLDPNRMSTYPQADVKTQISPRFGLAYKLGEAAVLHFSYGHFFQMPPMYALYQNHSYLVSPSDYATTMGNTQIKAQKTVQYEIGLWQGLTKNMGLEVSLYYRDIYDLLSTKIISTFNQIEYGLYTNKDYGNSRGLEIKYDFSYNALKFFMNYTLQYTRGNADNPVQNFDRAGANQDPVIRLIPMSWDQRHTFNATVGYYKQNYGVTLTGYYNSGTPYTWSPIILNPISRVNLYPNNSPTPGSYTVDLNSYYTIKLFGNLEGRITLAIYNLLDRLNPVWVYGSTGQPYTTIIQETDLQNHRSDFNTYKDRIQDPGAYSAPRMVKVGFGIIF